MLEYSEVSTVLEMSRSVIGWQYGNSSNRKKINLIYKENMILQIYTLIRYIYAIMWIHCAVITWIFTYWPCILRWIFVALRKENGLHSLNPSFIRFARFEKTRQENKCGSKNSGKSTKRDFVEGIERVCWYSMSLLIFALPFYLSSVKQKCILRFWLIFASCGNSGMMAYV